MYDCIKYIKDLCCIFRVLVDFKCKMKCESIEINAALDRLIGSCEDNVESSSLAQLLILEKAHKRLLRKLGHEQDKDDSFSLCDCDSSSTSSSSECETDHITLIDLLQDFGNLNLNKKLLTTFHEDIFNLFNAIIHYYSTMCEQPCLPKSKEMFKYIMYLVSNCLGERTCKCSKHTDACAPDIELYPIVLICYLSLHFGNKLDKYAQLLCNCSNKRSSGNATHKRISVSFCDNKLYI